MSNESLPEAIWNETVEQLKHETGEEDLEELIRHDGDGESGNGAAPSLELLAMEYLETPEEAAAYAAELAAARQFPARLDAASARTARLARRSGTRNVSARGPFRAASDESLADSSASTARSTRSSGKELTAQQRKAKNLVIACFVGFNLFLLTAGTLWVTGVLGSWYDSILGLLGF